MRNIPLLTLLILPALLAGAGCSQFTTQAISKSDAIRVVRDYLRSNAPDTTLADKPPTAEYLRDQSNPSANVWIVDFAVVPKYPSYATAAERGRRWGIAALVRPDGSVEGCGMHTYPFDLSDFTKKPEIHIGPESHQGKFVN